MKNASGFTIIELLLYTAISAAMIASISIILSTLLEIRVKNQSIVEVEQQGQIIMIDLTRAVRNADTVNGLPAATTGTTLSITENGNTSVYSLENGRLVVSVNGSDNTPLSGSKIEISNLVFSNFGRPGTKGLFRIEYTVSRSNPLAGAGPALSRTFFGSAAPY